MKAIVYHGINDVRLDNVETPRINENQALLKVKTAAICGTDLRVKAAGHRAISSSESRILGHEVSGVIVSTGKKVSGLSPGMRVSVAPVVGCGRCRQCLSGKQINCKDDIVLGLSINGGMAEYMVIPEQHIISGNVFILPDSMDFETAAIAEPLATVFTGLEACLLKPADVVLIVGAGPIGLMHMQMAKVFGAAKVLVSEVVESRRVRAVEFGADLVIDPLADNAVVTVMENSGGRGADVIIIAAAAPEAQSQSLNLAAVGGSINFFGTLPKARQDVILNTNLIHYKNLKLVGTTGSTVLNYYRTMELVISKKFDLSKYITSRFSFNDYLEGFAAAASSSALKVILEF